MGGDSDGGAQRTCTDRKGQRKSRTTARRAQSETICCEEEARERSSREPRPKKTAHIIHNPEMGPGRK